MSSILWWIGWAVGSVVGVVVILALLFLLWLGHEKRKGRNPFR